MLPTHCLGMSIIMRYLNAISLHKCNFPPFHQPKYAPSYTRVTYHHNTTIIVTRLNCDYLNTGDTTMLKAFTFF